MLPGAKERGLFYRTSVHTQVFASCQIEAVTSLVNCLHRRLPLQFVDGIATAEILLGKYRVLPRSSSRYGGLISQQEHRFPCLRPPDVRLVQQLYPLFGVNGPRLRITAVGSGDPER
jgi:hypothetical protein